MVGHRRRGHRRHVRAGTGIAWHPRPLHASDDRRTRMDPDAGVRELHRRRSGHGHRPRRRRPPARSLRRPVDRHPGLHRLHDRVRPHRDGRQRLASGLLHAALHDRPARIEHQHPVQQGPGELVRQQAWHGDRCDDGLLGTRFVDHAPHRRLLHRPLRVERRLRGARRARDDHRDLGRERSGARQGRAERARTAGQGGHRRAFRERGQSGGPRSHVQAGAS